MSLRNIKISSAFISGFCVMFFLLVCITAMAVFQVNKINDRLHIINDVNSVMQRYTINFRGSVHDRAIALRDVILAVDSADREQTLQVIAKLTDDYARSAKPLDEMFAAESESDPQEIAILDDIKAIEIRTLPLIEHVVALQLAGNTQEAHRILMQDARPAFVDWLAAINRFIDLKEAKNQAIGQDVRQIAQQFTMLMFGLCGLALLIGLFTLYVAVRSLKPLNSMTSIMLQLAKGDLDVKLPDDNTANEVGAIIGSVRAFKDNMLNARDMEKAKHAEQAAKEERQQKISGATETFKNSMARTLDYVARVVVQLQTSANALSSLATQVTEQSLAVGTVSTQASSSVQTVSSASEELTSSIHEIAQQIARSSEVAAKAVQDADQAGQQVGALVDAAQKIGEVTQMISDIAQQTNLLALNATIEAARAGDAGKGFAVVAAEVKNLASEAANATEQISSQIASIQNISRASAESIGMICKVIEEMSGISGSIAAAVQQQTAATQEISRSMNEVYNDTSGVSQSIGIVSDAAKSTGLAADEVQNAADEFSRQADQLRQEFDTFIQKVAAA